MHSRSIVHHLCPAALVVVVIVAVYVSEPAVNDAVQRLLGVGSAMATANNKAFALLPFSVFLTIRTGWYLLGFKVVLRLLKRDYIGRKSTPATRLVYLSKGFATGTAVMVAVIVAIAAFSGGNIGYVQSNTPRALAIAGGWIGCSLIGAAAEEVLYRGMIFITLDRFAGRSWAIIGSSLAFALSHVGNPGASKLWLLRLFIQGLLLAWAVARTGSLWWPIGYHAGWNFASAPLLGAVESGYSADGHLFSFVAAGPAWLTGGDVGPEGSVLAFVAMAAAAGVLLASTSRPLARGKHSADAPDMD